MFEAKIGEQGEILLSGRFDASQVDVARTVFDAVSAPQIVDLGKLDYISSAGLGVLLKTQKRLMESSGGGLKFVNVNSHIHDVFRYSGFDQIFEIQGGSA